jgi:hypothetical protein
MKDNRNGQPQRSDQQNELPKDVSNAGQESSLQNPLKVQGSREEEEADLEQQKKEAMTERD